MKNFKETLAEIQTAQNTIFSVTFIKKDGTVENYGSSITCKERCKR